MTIAPDLLGRDVVVHPLGPCGILGCPNRRAKGAVITVLIEPEGLSPYEADIPVCQPHRGAVSTVIERST